MMGALTTFGLLFMFDYQYTNILTIVPFLVMVIGRIDSGVWVCKCNTEQVWMMRSSFSLVSGRHHRTRRQRSVSAMRYRGRVHR
jgi:hypothetical protein